MKNLFFILLLFMLYAFTTSNGNSGNPIITQWRGDNRDGKYNEKNLMKSWPVNGPELSWSADSIGNGYGSPAVCDDGIYVQGEIDSIAYLFAFNLKGKLLWKSVYGREWMESYTGSRSTPTVVDDLIYCCSGMGDISCFYKANGQKKWSHHLITDYNGVNTRFGFAESLLTDGNILYATPGGTDTNLIALNRFTGELIWTAKGKGQQSAFCSPMLIRLAARTLIVTFSFSEFLGFDAKDGRLLWSQAQDTNCDIHANTAVYENGCIYYAAGCGNGMVKLRLTEDGSKITEVWRSRELINYFSGFISTGNKIFAADAKKKQWVSLDAGSGKLLDSLNFNKGISIYADSMLYLYNEKGSIGLVNPYANGMKLISSFKISQGSREHFTHPVIKNGFLYVRHGNALLAYDVRKKL
ncbi:MAG: PQQ-binding-like beta-propeller repeat protein [Bacteroidetes bacterium]|nr:PQQ-binding-like beta-propeller repeat protein [Bacteroidota bacterium]